MMVAELIEELKDFAPETQIAVFVGGKWQRLHEVQSHTATQDGDLFTLCPPNEGTKVVLLSADYE